MAGFTCEVCNYSHELAAEYGGTTITCPQCAAVIEVAPNPPPAVVSSAPDGSRSCPFCAEPIKSEARKCRWCGEILDRDLAIAKKRERVREVERRREILIKEAPGAKGALIIGLVGLLIGPPTLYGGFGLGPIAIAMGIAALRSIRKEPRLEGRGMARAGIILGILTIAGTILMLVTGITLLADEPA